MAGYKLTPSALADLEEIARYTLERWGTAQAMRYAARLDACFAKITSRTAIHRTFSEDLPQIKVTRCKHHYVFFVEGGNGKPEIIAILHERVELLQRLKHRLG